MQKMVRGENLAFEFDLITLESEFPQNIADYELSAHIEGLSTCCLRGHFISVDVIPTRLAAS